MTTLLSIDPGPKKSGWCILEEKQIIAHGKSDNEYLLDTVKYMVMQSEHEVVIEKMVGYGMPVGAEVFDTCVWIGRFFQAGFPFVTLMSRKEVKRELCGTLQVNDSKVRQAVIECFPKTGEGAVPQIGTKNQRGPLYGVAGDAWSALALAIAYQKVWGTGWDTNVW